MFIYLPIQLVTLKGAWQSEGSCKARVVLILRPRLGLLRFLMRTHKHLVFLSATCLKPLQQSGVGFFESPPTNGRHVDSGTNLSAHSALSWSKSELPSPTNIAKPKNKYGSVKVANFDESILAKIERKRGREKDEKG